MVGQTVETEDNMEIIDLDKTIETTTFERTLEDMEDKIIEENIVKVQNGWLVYDPMLIPWQLRFSLYSGQ